MKFCDYYQATFGLATELRYVRDREGREVDFLVTWKGIPWFMVECKLQAGPARGLRYFADRLGVEQRFLVTRETRTHYLDGRSNIHVIPAGRFLMALI